MRRGLRGLGLGWLALTLGAAAHAGVNTWTVVGPQGGYSRAVAFHPTQQNVVLLSADSSIYRSANLGQSWTLLRDDIPNAFQRMLFHPTDANRVIALGGNGLYRSTDGGSTFAHLDTAPSMHAPLAIAPDGTVYAAGLAGAVLKSTDFGDHWTDSSTGLPLAGTVLQDLVIDPQNANVLYTVVQGQGLYKSVDAGGVWTRQHTLLGMVTLKIAVDPGISNELLLASQHGLFASHDGGATWALEDAGGYQWVGYPPKVLIGAAIAIPLGQGVTLRRAGRGLAWVDGAPLEILGVEDAAFHPDEADPIGSTLFVASTEGPLLTQDGGMTFELRANDLRGGIVWQLVATPGPYGAAYAAFLMGPFGIYRQSGSGWLPVDNDELRAKIMDPFVPVALAVAPGQPETLLFAAGGTSLVRSLDGGLTWSAPHADLFGTVGQTAIAFAPSNPQVIYLGAGPNGVYRSDDQGVTWAQRSAGLPPGDTGDVAVDPTNDAIAYAAVESSPPVDGFRKTTNGGGSWTPSGSNNLGSVARIVTDPTNPAVLYAIGGGANQGLFKSTNAAQSWSRVGGPQGHGPVVDVAVDPVVPTTVFLVGNPNDRGASRSVDGGTLWEDLDFVTPAGFMPMRWLVLDPLRPHVAIAAVDNHGLVEIEIAPDLEVSIVSAPGVLPLGGSADLTVRVMNLGPFAASAVELTLTVPAGVAALAPPPGQSLCAPAGAALLRCTLGPMRVNNFIETTLALTGAAAPLAGTLVATAGAHERDPIQSNNAAAAAIAAERVADLTVTLLDSADPVTSGAAVEYTATVTNAGPNAVPAARITLDLAGVTASSASTAQGTCNVAAVTVTCALDVLATGGSATITVSALAGAAGSATASASATFQGIDTAAGNNAATQSTAVNAAPAPARAAAEAPRAAAAPAAVPVGAEPQARSGFRCFSRSRCSRDSGARVQGRRGARRLSAAGTTPRNRSAAACRSSRDVWDYAIDIR